MSKLPADLTNLEFHPLANLFPLIEGAEFDGLVADIRQSGLRDNIVLFEGKVLDGRNRYRAMLEIGYRLDAFFEVKTKADFVGGPIAWVLSKNLHRRHLTSGQRAMIAADIATMKAGARTDLKNPDVEHQPPANLQKVHREVEPEVPQEVSIPDAAQKLQVSPRSVSSAKKVQDQGTAGLADAVRGGDMAVSTAADIADLPVDEQVKAIESADPKAFAKVAKARRDEKTAAKKAKRVARERELGDKQLALPTRKFGVIYADPEWKFETYSAETGMDRAADNHYCTSSLEAIKARPVGDIAADDCVLFLWVTRPHLRNAMDVIDAWGFEYKSYAVWKKPKSGNGYWFRDNGEILVLATKGKPPCPAQGDQWDAIIDAPVGGHSEKPEIYHHLIEDYFPNLPKIELNARGVARDGWRAWGNETESDEARGITLVDGVSDASHLPLLPNPGKPRVGKENGGCAGDGPTRANGGLNNNGGGAGDGPTRANGGATKKSSPPIGTKTRKHKGEDISAPIVARVNIGDLELLVRVVDKKISFYAMQKHLLFPSELGCVSTDCFEIVTAANIGAVSKKIWTEKFIANASASMRASTWRLVTTPYKMGRAGPIPVMGSADGADK